MICPPCKQAGAYVTAVRELRPPEGGALIPLGWLTDHTLFLARQEHQKCETPASCPCHHDVTDERIVQ